MSGKRFEVNWPVVVLVVFLVGIFVVAFVPSVWTVLVDSAIQVITALKGLF